MWNSPVEIAQRKKKSMRWQKQNQNTISSQYHQIYSATGYQMIMTTAKNAVKKPSQLVANEEEYDKCFK